MLEKHYKERFSHIRLESRWIFTFSVISLSVLTSFFSYTFSGREVDATLSQLESSQSVGAARAVAAPKKSQVTLFQIAQLEIGQGKIIKRKITPTPTPIPQAKVLPASQQVQQYGKATQIDEHTWTMTVQNDGRGGSAQEILQALNNYRSKMGISQLIWNDTLSTYAQARANEFSQKGALDGHAGFMDFMNHQDGFSKLGFNSLGENSSFGYILLGPRLIEEVYAADSEHNNNQLNPAWTHVGIGVSGTATDLIFGGKKR